MKRVLLSAVLCMAFSAISSATIVFQQSGAIVNNGNGTFTYNYTAALPNGFNFRNADFFTVYDIVGLTLGSETFTKDAGLGAGVSFTVTHPLVGATPAGTGPFDNPNINNIQVTLNSGGPILAGGGTDVQLGVLTFVSTMNTTVLGDYTSISQNRSNSSDDVQLGHVLLPTQGRGVPEPATYVLMGSGLIGLVMAARRRAARS